MGGGFTAGQNQYRAARFAVVIAALLLRPLLASAQISEKQLLELIAKNDYESARQSVEQVARLHPNSPITLYFQALLESDAARAIDLYRELAKKFPESEFAPKATYRMGQFYFARGFYHSSRKNFLDVSRMAPGSALADLAGYFAAKCLFAAGLVDSARIALKAVLANSQSQLLIGLAREDLAAIESSRPAAAGAATAVANPAQEGVFTVQIGAYASRENAESQKKYFALLGYPVEIYQADNGKRPLFRVRIGRFRNRDAALEFAESFRRRFKMQYQIMTTNGE